MDLGKMFRILWDLGISLAHSVKDIWEWLNSPHDFGVDLGFTYLGLENIVPINLLGAGIMILILAWIIKGLIL